MDLQYDDEYEEEVDEGEEETYQQPTQEEMEYLELRKRLKERIRRQMKKDGGSVAHNELPDKKRNLPYDNYGSFFGPSQPSISKRVIEECKSLLETRHFTSKSSVTDVSHESVHLKKDPSLVSNGTIGKPTFINEVKMKAKKLKDARDYSFLLSDDAELPQAQSPVNLKLEMLKSREESKGKHVPPSNMRQLQSRFEGRGAIFANNAKKHNSGSLGPTPSNKSQSKPAAPSSFSKQPVSNLNSNGIRRPVEIKGNSRIPPTSALRPAPPSSKSSFTKNVKNHSSNLSTSLPKKPFSHQSKPSNIPNQRVKAKETVMPSRNTVNRPSKITSNTRPHEYRDNRNTSNRYFDEDEGDEDDQAINMIRKMFGYNPNRFSSRDDDDDSDMEANFTDIQEEEKRSSRIARREDEEELRKIEEEEEMMRLRKLERKRKLNQR